MICCQISTESNLESVDEDEIDPNNQLGRENIADGNEPNGSDGEGTYEDGLRKLNSLPSSLYKKSK